MNDFVFQNRRLLYEIECPVLEAILSTAFDWKELANRLISVGREIPKDDVGVLQLPQVIQRMTHSACKIEGELSSGITNTLNCLHRSIMDQVSAMEISEICVLVHEVSIRDRAKVSGLLWAIATDPREGSQRLAGIFVRRIISELFTSAFSLSSK